MSLFGPVVANDVGQAEATPPEPKIISFIYDPARDSFSHLTGDVEAFLGFPAERWFTRGFLVRCLHPDDLEPALRCFERCLHERRDHQVEFRLIAADDRVIWVQRTAQIIIDDSGRTMIQGMLIEVTERIDQDTDLRESLHLNAELLRLLTEQVGGPLKTLSGFGQLLERHLSTLGDDVGSEYALGMRGGLEKLSQVLGHVRPVTVRGVAHPDDIAGSIEAIRGIGFQNG